MKKLKEYLKNPTVWLVVILLLVAALTHAYNMFHFPYFENDEGTYMSQAWSVVKLGALSPYTYWYDHAPAGWIFIALWTKLTGGFFTFGYSVYSGRVFMLVLHVLIAGLLFFVTKRLSKSNIASTIAVLVFTLSPIGVYFQRRILLDNIMIFWIFVALSLLLVKKLKLRHIILSSVCFGIAVLTKENAIFFGPAFLYVIYVKSHSKHRFLAVTKWLVVAGVVVSLYFLYALLKREFFPVGFFGDSAPRVSLVSTLSEQYSRGSGYPIWDMRSEIYKVFFDWIYRDVLLVVLGGAAFLSCVILGVKNVSFRIAALFTGLFVLFLVRGGLVLDFYIIPLIPFLGMCIGMTLDYVSKTLSLGSKHVYYFIGCIFIVFIPASIFVRPIDQYVRDETTPQIQALEWIEKSVPKDAVIATDAFAEVEYREMGYKNAIWFWKMWTDDHEKKKFGNSWENIEYIFLTHESLKQIGQQGEGNVLQKALQNSVKVASFGPNSDSTVVVTDRYITTNGDWAAVYKRKDDKNIVLDNSWEFYKNNFIHSYGQVIDPQTETTTSEGQSYAMMRAVIMDDKNTFDGVWRWTQDHLQHREDDMLLSWVWGSKGGKEGIIDSANATDADEDIAFSLILAYYKWDDEEYLDDTRVILSDIWDESVVSVNGKYYLIAGADFSRPGGYVVNPSYVSPGMYKIFAAVDPNHSWEKLADDSYLFLDQLNDMSGSSADIPRNWVFLSQQGQLSSASRFVESEGDVYSYNAFRTHWRVALDYLWFRDERAISYLRKSDQFFAKEWESNKKFSSSYNMDGSTDVSFTNLSTAVGPLSVLSLTKPELGQEVVDEFFSKKYDERGFWSDGENYYDQNWAWLGTALHYDLIPLPGSLRSKVLNSVKDDK